MRPRIALVDYGAGNLRSVAKALERSEMDPIVTSDPTVVRDADGVLLPGVGAFRNAVNALEKAGLADAIRNVTDHGRPYLGICFGLQLLFDEGEEHGLTPGLGRLAGQPTCCSSSAWARGRRRDGICPGRAMRGKRRRSEAR